MNKKLIVLFAVSIISMQVMASDKNAELAARAEQMSSHILEALVNESIAEAQAVVNKSMMKKRHDADAFIKNNKLLRDADRAGVHNQLIIPILEASVVRGGLMKSGNEQNNSGLSEIPKIGYLFAPHNNFYWEGGSAVLSESGYLPPQSSQTLTSQDVEGLIILNDIKRTLTARRQQSDDSATFNFEDIDLRNVVDYMELIRDDKDNK